MQDTTCQLEPSALLEHARRAMSRAYAPYSSFKVGAALLTANGAIVTGCNVENASYGLTLCAERVAMGAAIAAGHRDFSAIAILSSHAAPCTPCGACRQVLAEFAPDLRVILEQPDGQIWEIALGELLPHQFTFSSLPARP
ncbi:MAG: cytidine deaminase [Cyanobacteria bacterium REEB65]|nr:cytidine deaminase [Cyanobacteria bacterium REEB65]